MSDALRILEAFAQASEIGRRIGFADHLATCATEIATELKALPVLSERVTVKPGGQGRFEPYLVKRVAVRAGVRRSIKMADLKRRYPFAYAAAVTESAPNEVYQVRLDPLKSGTRSTEWAAIKAEGATAAADALAARFGTWDWASVERRAAALFGVREMAAGETKRIATAKRDLVEFVTANDLPLIIPGHFDGRLVLRENPIKRSVDYAVLEQRFPDAAAMITRTPTAAQERLIFVKPGIDPDEVDDSDDSAWGIWKS